MPRAKRPLRLRTLEQGVGIGYHAIWDPNLPAPRVDVEDGGAGGSRFTYYSTKSLDKLKKAVTKSPYRIGESVQDRNVVFTNPLNERKSLIRKVRHYQPRPRSPYVIHKRPEPRTDDSSLEVDPFERSMVGSGWDVGAEDADSDDDSVDIAYYNADGSGSALQVVIPAVSPPPRRASNQSRPASQTKSPSSSSRPSSRKSSRPHSRGSIHSSRSIRTAVGSQAPRSSVDKLQRLVPPAPKKAPSPRDALGQLGYAFARQNYTSHTQFVKSVSSMAEERARLREEQKQSRRRNLEKFYLKVREEGLEDFDNLDSSSTEDEDSEEDDEATQRKYSKYHPLAARARQKLERRRERQRQRMKRRLERQIEKKALALTRGEDLWGDSTQSRTPSSIRE